MPDLRPPPAHAPDPRRADSTASRGEGPQLVVLRGQPPGEANDAQLACAALADDPRAPAAIWDRFSPMVRAMLRRSLGPGADVEDATQEVFLRLFRRIGDLRDPSALRSFIIGFTLRVARRALRLRLVGRWLHLTGGSSSDRSDRPDRPSPPADHEAREALRRFYAVLDRLGNDARLLFVLRAVEGLELTEVAQAMGISLATVKRRLARVTRRVTAMAEADPLLAEYLHRRGRQLAEGDHR